MSERCNRLIGFRAVIFFMIYVLSTHVTHSQELPPISIYTPEHYHAENQNWQISQSDNGHIFVANNSGLLEFNGEDWSLYPSPNQTIMRSVHVVKDRVYTGCYMEFGYWQQTDVGLLVYTSLNENLSLPMVEDEEFWNIIDFEGKVIFQSLNRVYLYDENTNEVEIIEANGRLMKLLRSDSNIYFQVADKGIYEIDNGVETLVWDEEAFNKAHVLDVFSKDGQLFLATANQGILIYDNQRWKWWDVLGNEALRSTSLYSFRQSKNGNLLAGSISDGLIILDSEGAFVEKYDKSKGLQNNTILSVFESKENDLWLGLDHGLSCINIESPFKIYHDNIGNLGTIYASIMVGEDLYLGSNQGLFHKNALDNDQYKLIKGTEGQVWSLQLIKGKLFCGHNSGTYVIEGNNAQQIFNESGTWKLSEVPEHNNLLLQGNYDGLYVLENVKGVWKKRNKLEGFVYSSRYFEFVNSENLLVNHEYKGVFHLVFDPEMSTIRNVEEIESVQKALKSSLVKFHGNILYASNVGIYYFDDKSYEFRKDSLLSKELDLSASAKLVYDKPSDALWSFYPDHLTKMTQGKLSNNLILKRYSVPSASNKIIAGFENIASWENDKLLLGTADAYMLLDLNKIIEQDYQLSINSVEVHEIRGENRRVNYTENVKLKAHENNLKINFSVIEFDGFIDVQYRHKLIGLYSEWSSWSFDSSVEFDNLPFGEYTFVLGAKVGDQELENQPSFSFSIARPWYISIPMLILYVLGVLLFSRFMHLRYKRYYKAQQDKILQESNNKLALKELENNRKIIELRNAQLETDIKSKNRELASSTMGLVKKNEILSDIKQRLISSKLKDSGVQSAIKVIDKNLNNQDDWNRFEEAFNNADKDFIKTLKTRYPALTSGDLRLCTYLRLNLSSKEIAPLLNVSTKSLEVKRYRLRKKLELEHDQNLNDFILSI